MAAALIFQAVSFDSIAVSASEGSPCTYDCRICPVEELIAALPDAADIRSDNADEVRAQLEEIPENSVAEIEKEGAETVYVTAEGLDDAFKNSGNDGAAFTLLKDVESEKILEIVIDCTLNLGGHNMKFTDEGIFIHEDKNVTIEGEGGVISVNSNALDIGGTVTLKGGTFTGDGENFAGVNVISEKAALSVTGQTVVIQNTGGGYGLSISNGASVQLSDGKYSGEKGAIQILDFSTLGDLLAHTDDTCYAYFDSTGTTPFTGKLAEKSLAGTVTVKECSHTGDGVCEYTHTFGTTTHQKNCLACGLVESAEKCSVDGTGKCRFCDAVLAVRLSADQALIYNGTEQKPDVTVAVDGQTLTAENHYTAAYANNVNAGDTAKIIVTGTAFEGTVELPFTIEKAPLTITANGQAITYGGSIAQGPGQVTAAGLCTGDTLKGVILTASSDQVAAENKTIMPSAAEIQNGSGADAAGSYNITYQPGALTINKADAPAAGQETRNYTYASGSKGAVTIDVSGKFPADRGATAYTVKAADTNGILSGVSVDANGNLTFKVLDGQSKGDTASVMVTAEMANYKDATYTVEIELVEKIAVKFTLTAQDSAYDGKSHNGCAGLAAQTINGSYIGAVRFWYAGTGGTSYDSATPPVHAGSYTVTASVPEDDAEHEGSSEAVPFTICKAAITIKAENKTAQAGSSLPELTYTVSGLAENEQLAAAPELSCSADMNTAGVYPITAGGAKVPDTNNYQEEITYENGTLTVLDSAVHVTGVSLDKSTLSLSTGSTGRLTAVLLPENAADKSVSWASGNPAVASVDSSGNITAVSAGTAVITVTTADGGHTASCMVTVRKNTGGSMGSSGSGSFGSGSFGGSSGSSAGPGSTGSGIGQAAKQPFIKDSSGREGWDVIRAAAETAAAVPAGGTVTVDMNGAVSVPGSVFAAIRGKDVTLRFDMGDGIIWSVNGRDVTAETAGGTDFSVKTDAGAIPKGLMEETAGGLAHMELSLAHEGTFGFTATLTLRIVSRDGNGITTGSSATAGEYTGMYANLFYYNQNLRSLEFVCAGQIGEDGTADLPFVHASDYTVILSAVPMGGTGAPGRPQEPAKQTVKSVKLSKTLYTYNGKPKKPSVTAVDTAGRKISAAYFTVSYQNNKKAGKAAATVVFKGSYSGTVKKTFTIRPAGTSIQKLTAVSGGFAVKWKKNTAQTSGYQIQYSADAGFQGNSTHSIFVKNNSWVQKTVKNLKGGKKYYVRIRTYKTVKADGKNTRVYSAWSKARKVKSSV